jgi:cytochrome c peroxidase
MQPRTKRSLHLLFLFTTVGLATSPVAGAADAATSASEAHGQDTLADLKALYRRPAEIPFPADNPYSAEKATLGKMLFFDPRLSVNQNLSCASCHNPSFGWEAALPLSVGAANTELPRHSPTILNLAWSASQYFWDGRAGSLEEQALGPITSPIEMNMPTQDLERRVAAVAGYRERFETLYAEGVTAENIAGAIATFERTIVSDDAPFDRWIEGDEAAISAEAKAGFMVFNGKAGCSGCHSGWNFTDNGFHDIGLPTEDEGRYVQDDSSIKNLHAFKTPGLRNIVSRAPYMHNGSLPTLEAVVATYNTGGIPRASRSELIRPVGLNAEESAQLVAFLRTLEGDDRPMTLPQLPH